MNVHKMSSMLSIVITGISTITNRWSIYKTSQQIQNIQQQMRPINIDIECEYRHNIALRINGDNQSLLSLLIWFKEKRYTYINLFIVDKIKVGCRHNWIKTKQGKTYMFRSNDYNECLVFDIYGKDMILHHCIDKIVKTKSKIGKISDVTHTMINYFKDFC